MQDSREVRREKVAQGERREFRGVLFALVGGSLWGFSGTAVSYLFRNSGIAPTWVMAVRLVLAGLLFLGFSALRRNGRPLRLLKDRRAVLELLLFALGGLALNQFCYLMAIQATNSATATVLQSLQLLPVMVVACVMARRGPKKRELLGLILALAGTVLIATGGNLSQMVLPADGLLFGLLCALGGAGIAVFPRRILSEYGVMAVNGWAMLLVGLLTIPFVPDWGQAAAGFDPSCWVVFAALVVFGTFCSYLFYMQGVAEIGSLKTALLSTAEPISATILSVLWIGVVLTPTDLVGSALIIVMMLLVA